MLMVKIMVYLAVVSATLIIFCAIAGGGKE